MREVRCKKIVKGYLCNRLLGMVEGKYSLKCPKCGTLRVGDTRDENTKKESVENENNTCNSR